MSNTYTNTIIDILNSFRDAINEREHLYGRFMVSLYNMCSETPSQEIINAIGLAIVPLDSILSDRQLSFLTEHYRDVVKSLVTDHILRLAYSNNPLPNEHAITAAINHTLNKGDRLFIIGSGINHFIMDSPANEIYGIETNPYLWGMGQIYLSSQGWNNVTVFRDARDVKRQLGIKTVLVLSATSLTIQLLKHEFYGCQEIVSILPKEACAAESYREFRAFLLNSRHLYSVTTTHDRKSGVSVFYCQNTTEIELSHTHSFIDKIAFWGRKFGSFAFSKDKQSGLAVFIRYMSNLLIIGVATAIVAMLITKNYDVKNVILILGGLSFAIYVAWIIAFLVKRENNNPPIQFTTVLQFGDSDYNGWNNLLRDSLKGPFACCHANKIRFTSITGEERSTLISSRSVLTKSILDDNFVSYVHSLDGDTRPLSSLITIVTPGNLPPEKEDLNVLKVHHYGAPLSLDYLSCEIKDFTNVGFKARKCIPAGTYIWRYDSQKPRLGHVSDDCALNNTFPHWQVLFFTPKTTTVEEPFLLRELLSDFVLEQLLWMSSSPSIEELLKIRIRVPSAEEQNRVLRADAFEKLNREHEAFVSMVTNHKHEVGNLLKFLYYDFDTLKFMIERTGGLSIEDIVDSKKGSTVRDYFNSIEGYKNAISQEMVNFWNDGYGKSEMFNLSECVSSFVKTKSTSPYRIEVCVPNDSVVVFSKKGLLTILRNIFVNAEKHGFTDKNRKDYVIRITQQEIKIEESVFARLIVSNNGNPLPEGINKANMFEKGVGTGNSEHIGCCTIKEICDQFCGSVYIEQHHHKEEFTLSYILDIPKPS